MSVVTRSQRSTGVPTGTPSSVGVGRLGRVGADRLGRAAQLDAEQLVERLRSTSRRDKLAPSSAGHHTVTTANGSPSARLSRFTRSTCVDVEHASRTWPAAATNANSRTWRSACLPLASSWASIVPRRPSCWRTRLGGDEPAEALAGRDQALVAQHLERPADRDPAGAELGRQLDSLGNTVPGGALASGDPFAQLVGDLLVPDRLMHLY